MTEHSAHTPDHRLERMIFFSDAVFAIAITLLVLEIKLPELSPGAGNREWAHALKELLPRLADFVLSFVVIGLFWSGHHRVLALVQRFDRRMTIPNMAMLMFIALLPFSTGLVSSGPPSAIPFAFYAGNLLLASLAKAWLAGIALQPRLLWPGAPHRSVAVELRWRWVLPAVTAAALLLAPLAPGWNMMVMLLIAVARRLPAFHYPQDD